MGLFSRKVSRAELLSILKDLDLVTSVEYYGFNITPSVRKSDKWYQNIGGQCLDDIVQRLDKDDDNIDEKIDILLDYLKLEIVDGKRIIKKKGKR